MGLAIARWSHEAWLDETHGRYPDVDVSIPALGKWGITTDRVRKSLGAAAIPAPAHLPRWASVPCCRRSRWHRSAGCRRRRHGSARTASPSSQGIWWPFQSSGRTGVRASESEGLRSLRHQATRVHVHKETCMCVHTASLCVYVCVYTHRRPCVYVCRPCCYLSVSPSAVALCM